MQKANWTVTINFDPRAVERSILKGSKNLRVARLAGLKLKSSLPAVLSKEISDEIDREIMKDLIRAIPSL